MKTIPLFVISLCLVCCRSAEEQPDEITVNGFERLVAAGKDIYASTFEAGLFHLEDGKDSWQRVEGFYFNPLLGVSETTAFAVDGEYIHRLNKGKSEPWVNISSDRGWGSWRDKGIWSLLVVGDTIYMGKGNGRIYRATGSERPSWVAVANTAIGSLAISGTTLYAGSGAYPDFNEGNGVFRSMDWGDSWAPVNTGLTEQNIASLAVSGTTLYAGTPDGVFRLEHDDSWTHVGLSGLPVLSLIGEPGTTRIYAGTRSFGVLRSPNGVSWNNTGLSGLSITGLAISGKYLYAATSGSPRISGVGGILRRKTPHGKWTPFNKGLGIVRH